MTVGSEGGDQWCRNGKNEFWHPKLHDIIKANVFRFLVRGPASFFFHASSDKTRRVMIVGFFLTNGWGDLDQIHPSILPSKVDGKLHLEHAESTKVVLLSHPTLPTRSLNEDHDRLFLYSTRLFLAFLSRFLSISPPSIPFSWTMCLDSKIVGSEKCNEWSLRHVLLDLELFLAFLSRLRTPATYYQDHSFLIPSKGN